VRIHRLGPKLALALALACVALARASGAQPAPALPNLLPDAEWRELAALYRHFHANPELSFDESETATRLARELAAVGVVVTPGVGGHGVVGLLENGPGPVLMLRTDLDALPVTEATELLYASQVVATGDAGAVGVMHACGHDVHITNLVGTARALAAHRDQWRGTVMFVGQPAEERGAGARAMLEDGLFQRFPRPDYALALHVKSDLPAGEIALAPGYMLANVDSVDIALRGRGGHGAAPHLTIDPVVQAAQLVLDLQTLVSRETNPTDAAVVTVGALHCGAKHNVISDRCDLMLTVRSYSDEVRGALLAGIERKARAVAASAGAPEPEVAVSEGTPSLRNDDALAQRLRPVLEAALGAERVRQDEPVMGGEDFSRYGRAGVPILMIRLGSVDAERLAQYTAEGRPPPSLHSGQYYPDIDATLATGVHTMATATFELLQP